METGEPRQILMMANYSGFALAWLPTAPVGLYFLIYRILGETTSATGMDQIGHAFWSWSALIMAYVFLISKPLRRHQVKGEKLIKADKFEEAIPFFQASYAFFSRYTRLDHFRQVLLINLSTISMRECSLINIAVCYIQLERFDRAKTQLKEGLKDLPDSKILKAYFFSFEKMEKSIVSKFEASPTPGFKPPQARPTQ